MLEIDWGESDEADDGDESPVIFVVNIACEVEDTEDVSNGLLATIWPLKRNFPCFFSQHSIARDVMPQQKLPSLQVVMVTWDWVMFASPDLVWTAKTYQ